VKGVPADLPQMRRDVNLAEVDKGRNGAKGEQAVNPTVQPVLRRDGQASQEQWDEEHGDVKVISVYLRSIACATLGRSVMAGGPW